VSKRDLACAIKLSLAVTLSTFDTVVFMQPIVRQYLLGHIVSDASCVQLSAWNCMERESQPKMDCLPRYRSTRRYICFS